MFKFRHKLTGRVVTVENAILISEYRNNVDFEEIEVTESEPNVYQENGYEDRADYLQAMSDEYDCPLDVVHALADLLGESEDFDGLISGLRDYEAIR